MVPLALVPYIYALGVCLPAMPTISSGSLSKLFGAQQLLHVRGFLPPELVSALVADVHSLRARQAQASHASAAHGSVEWHELLPNAPEAHPEEDATGLGGRERLLQLVCTLSSQLEEATGTSLDAQPELKYAYYPCGGRYQRHIDGFNAGSIAREWSFLLYLNEGWSPSDGGYLRVHDLGGSGDHLDIAPEAGTLVLFKSDVVSHEVMPTTARRLAIVGWLHRHQEAPREEEAESLTPLARAIREHYRGKGEAVKLASSSPAHDLGLDLQ